MKVFKKNWPLIIFVISILLHLFFYVSAHFTHSLDIFFEHVTRGQDFFQVPNGAHAFWRGGSLQGELPGEIKPYTSCCGVNPNVYHPFFTLLVGTPLQFFSPWTAFGLWTIVHLLVSAMIIIIFWKKFKSHQHLYLALFLYLLNSYHYYEIQHAQYHFLLLLFSLLFLYESCVHGDTKKAGFWYFLSLLIKPIGFLWIIPLLLYKRFKTVIFGLGFYILTSLPFLFWQSGNYYFFNLLSTLRSQRPTYNLLALSHFVQITPDFFKNLSFFTAIFLIVYQIFRKPSLFSIIFLWTAFQLIFYSLTFHYHYSLLAGLISLGILLNIFSVKWTEMVPIFFITIPTPIIFLRLFWKAEAILTDKQLSSIALWSVFWLILLCYRVVFLSKNKFHLTKE